MCQAWRFKEGNQFRKDIGYKIRRTEDGQMNKSKKELETAA